MRRIQNFHLLLFLLLFSLKLNGQIIQNNSKLILKEIMKGAEFIGHSPDNIAWSFDGQSILFDWNPKNEPGNSSYYFPVGKATNTPAKVGKALIFPYDKAQSAFSKNYYEIDGALIELDKKTKQSRLVFQSNDAIGAIQRSSSGKLVFFQQGINLMCYDAQIGSFVQVTNFRKGEHSDKKTDSTYWMKEEVALFNFIQDKNNTEKWRRNNSVKHFNSPKDFFIGKQQLENLQIHPNAAFITFRLSTYPTEEETHVENHISSDGHTFTSPARSKVSDADAEPTHRLGIYSIAADSVYFVNFSKLSDIRKKPSYLNNTEPYASDRKIVMHQLQFAKDSSRAICDIRSYDNKDRWIVLIDLKTGNVRELDHQMDEAWIGGPGISGWNTEDVPLGWLNDGKTIYFQSEQSGYSHLYTYSLSTGEKKQLTSGKWEIYDLSLSLDGKSFYITGNRSHPGNRDFLRYDIAAQKIVPILTKDGYHQVLLSPDEKTLSVRFSTKNKPWELYTAPNITNTKLSKITNSTTAEFNAYAWKEPEVITFQGSDGKEVYARLYNPGNTKNKAAVIFVHGAGYLQNAHNYWSTYHREYMFHNLLVDNGFTVLDIDYRGSEGYGRDYRTAIYRNMGGQDLQDNIAGKEYLIRQLGIDSNRVGIYGGSYGGFITLMAMLKTPGEFACGAALRSVTDWAHYNHEYTSNILNYPTTDPEAYKKSSPIYYAKNLEGKLLLLHGMVDDNVQFQDVVRLSQRFIELEKENWELAVFPVEAHGFKKSTSWNDEYRRIYELFYSELLLKHAK